MNTTATITPKNRRLTTTGASEADFGTVAPFVPSPYLSRKRVAARFIGLLLAVLLAPVIGLLALAVRLSSPGPGLYRQRRVGHNGKVFSIYKLRSMRQDAEATSGPVWATKKDARTTRLGRILRWTHMDELPQIFNIVRGEMGFVGPRPERPEIVATLRTQIANYDDRHAATPGITGIAQVNLHPDRTIECVRHKVAADRYYIENASLWLDLRLIAATLLRVVGIRYQYGARLLGVTLPAHLVIPPVTFQDARAEASTESLPAFGQQGVETVSRSLEDTDVGIPALKSFARVEAEAVGAKPRPASRPKPPRRPR